MKLKMDLELERTIDDTPNEARFNVKKCNQGEDVPRKSKIRMPRNPQQEIS